jgi:hypothetical protein
MKTLREILFQRHRSAEAKLDAIRENALAGIAHERSCEEKNSISPIVLWREIFSTLRWHLAGMSAAWLLVLLLNSESPSAIIAAVSNENSPSPKQLVLALRENRRQIAEMIEAPTLGNAPISVPHALTPPRHSEIQFQTEMA